LVNVFNPFFIVLCSDMMMQQILLLSAAE